jgi:hypothetical protein
MLEHLLITDKEMEWDLVEISVKMESVRNRQNEEHISYPFVHWAIVPKM